MTGPQFWATTPIQSLSPNKDIHDLNFEIEKLESTEGVDSVQAATAKLHEDWLDIKSVDVGVPKKGLSTLFSSGQAEKVKLENKKRLKAQEAQEAFQEYYKQGEPRKSDHQTDLIQIC